MKTGRDKRLIVAVRHRLGVRLHAAVAVVHRQQLQPVPVHKIVGIAKVSEGVRVFGDAPDQHLVVLAADEIGADTALVADHREGEIVEGPRVAPGAEQSQGLSGKAGTDLVPGHDLVLRRGLPHPPEFAHLQAAGELILRVDHDRDAVEGDGEFDVLCPALSGRAPLPFRRWGAMRR